MAVGAIGQSVIGYRGTKTATYVVKPDMAIVLTGFETNKSSPKISRNDGVILGYYDRQKLLKDIQSVVNDVKPYIGNYGNDGSFIHKTLKGTPTISMGVALSHIGSGHEIFSLSDVDCLVDGLVKYIKSLSSQKINDIGFGSYND